MAYVDNFMLARGYMWITPHGGAVAVARASADALSVDGSG